MEIVKIINYSKFPDTKLLELIGTAAEGSSHPVDRAIVKYLREKDISFAVASRYFEEPGEGITAIIGKTKILAGRPEFLARHKVKSIKDGVITKYKNDGFGVTPVAVNNIFSGIVVFADELRPYAKEIVRETKRLGVEKWVVLTGDNEKVAGRISATVGADEFRSGLRPGDKLKIIEEYKSKTKILAMIGDGVNDAASLAMADVSFAMGAIGSDAAISAADVTLSKDKLERIAEAMILAKKTRRVIIQCFIGWVLTNGVGLILVFTGVLSPAWAAAYNFLTDFIPIFNALRINTLNISVYNKSDETHNN